MPDVNELTALLEQLDRGEPRDVPFSFDYESAVRRFHQVRREMEAELEQELSYETGNMVQDAAYHSDLVLPSPLGPASIRFSNFGNLTAIWGDQLTVPPEMLKRVGGVVESHGYIYIPFALLERPYHADEPDIPNWWERFFGYS